MRNPGRQQRPYKNLSVLQGNLHDAFLGERELVTALAYPTDYKTPGYYFITLCANGRACLFGEILNGKMRLNAAGQMIQSVWHGISERYTGWSVDTLIVMPNHVHVIIVLCDGSTPTLSLPELMRNIISYTMTCYRHGVHNNNWLEFHKHLWQRSYHEHVIRNEISLENIRNYILNNPAQWEMDEENPANLEAGHWVPVCL